MQYNAIAAGETVAKTIASLKNRGVDAEVVKTKADALLKIQSLIPQGASVMNGASVTLEQVGFIDLLKSGTHGWNNLHDGILAETDPAKQAELRKTSVLSDYYLGSVHALAETGEFLIASNTGSQLPHIVFTSKNLILVVGTNKIVPTLSDAWSRLQEHVVPLEDARAMKAYGAHTSMNKVVTFFGENPYMGRKVTIILVEEELGY